jgi:hypothetical protein
MYMTSRTPDCSVSSPSFWRERMKVRVVRLDLALTLALSRKRLCRNDEKPHGCHAERSEASRIFSHLRKRDPSAVASG